MVVRKQTQPGLGEIQYLWTSGQSTRQKKDISIEKAEGLCRRMILVCVSPDKFSGLSLALNKDGL